MPLSLTSSRSSPHWYGARTVFVARGNLSPTICSKNLLVSATKAIKPAFAPGGTEIPAAAIIPLSAKMQAFWVAVGSTALAHIVFV